MFGISVNICKSVLTPVDEVEFLGVLINVDGTMQLAPRRFSKLHAMAKSLLGLYAMHRRFVPFKALRSFLGVAASTYEVVPRARLYTFHLYAELAEYQRRYSTCSGYSHKCGLAHLRVKLRKPALKELLFWGDLQRDECRTTLFTPVGIAHLYTDASQRMWGAVLLQNGKRIEVSGLFPPDL